MCLKRDDKSSSIELKSKNTLSTEDFINFCIESSFLWSKIESGMLFGNKKGKSFL